MFRESFSVIEKHQVYRIDDLYDMLWNFILYIFYSMNFWTISFVRNVNRPWKNELLNLNFENQILIDFRFRFKAFISVKNSRIILLLIFLFSIIIQNSKSISRSYELSFQQWFQRVCSTELIMPVMFICIFKMFHFSNSCLSYWLIENQT